jgi:hypothetical protein
MAGLGIALKDFLALSKLQEITPGAKFNLACPYFSSVEVTCRIARVTSTKVVCLYKTSVSDGSRTDKILLDRSALEA